MSETTKLTQVKSTHCVVPILSPVYASYNSWAQNNCQGSTKLENTAQFYTVGNTCFEHLPSTNNHYENAVFLIIRSPKFHGCPYTEVGPQQHGTPYCSDYSGAKNKIKKISGEIEHCSCLHLQPVE